MIEKSFFLLAVAFVFFLFSFYIIQTRKTKHEVYQKNFFDWIIYVLAWLVVPFMFFSTIGDILIHFDVKNLLGSRNWEERRRFNLYVFLGFCLFIGLGFLIFYTIPEVPSSVGSYDFFLLFFYIFAVITDSFWFFWVLTEYYENHLKNKTYFSEDTIVNRKTMLQNH